MFIKNSDRVSAFWFSDRTDFSPACEILIRAHLSSPLSGSSPRQEEVRPQDTVSVIGGVAGSSKHGRKAAWKFVKDNWEELYNRYQGGFLISRLIKVETKTAAASASHTEAHEDVSSHIHSVWWIRKKLIQVLGDELQCLFAFVCSCSLLFAAHS